MSFKIERPLDQVDDNQESYPTRNRASDLKSTPKISSHLNLTKQLIDLVDWVKIDYLYAEVGCAI